MNDDGLGDDVEAVTAEDVAYINREMMRDTAVWGRRAGTALMIVGVLGGVAWLWLTVRTQQHIQGRGITFGSGEGGPNASLVDRLDASLGTIGFLLESALTAGVGAALMLLSNHVTVAYGGTLSGLEEGDALPPSSESDGSE